MAHEIWIDDIIGEDWYGEGISAKSMKRSINEAGDERILLRINSPGGDVFEGASILTQLSQHKPGVDVQVDGIAASCASYIAMVGEKVAISDGGIFMIHDPWTICVGDSRAMVKEAGLLDRVAESLALAYINRTGKTPEEIREAMQEETWLDAQESVEFGLADEVLTTVAKSVIVPESMGYKNAPKTVRKDPEGKTPAIGLRGKVSLAAMKRQNSRLRALWREDLKK